MEIKLGKSVTYFIQEEYTGFLTRSFVERLVNVFVIDEIRNSVPRQIRCNRYVKSIVYYHFFYAYNI